MTAGLIAIIVVLVVVLGTLARSVRIVPQARAAVIERLGRYVRTASPGLTLLVPFVDRMRPMIDLREQVVSFPPQPVITSDNLTVGVDSVIYFQVTEPRAATYEIANYIQAVEQLTITTLRNVIGSLNLEQALTSRDEINSKLRGVLDEATGPWGIRVARVEIKAIDPPPSIQDAMEQQMRADRNKRALILTAEGQRESAIKTAEGNKAAQILDAEGRKQAAILSAEAERQSRILKAEGERAALYLAAQGQAKAVETTFAAIHAAKPDPALLAYQYLQTLPQIAKGDANKMWVVPSEFSKALDGLAKMTGDGDTEPSWLAQTGTGAGAAGDASIDTSSWFDSNLPPAAEQPEAVDFRASDADPDSIAAEMDAPGAHAADVAEILRERLPTQDDPPPPAPSP
ncbi:SPFH domain-containing protein [Jatrophihabitans endophyticus]|uniref:SPFH domain-containing protein n=1 Tax=Jatrophihabitans endophyticus TaxID=1206085 RepID=UPI001A0CC3AC|nr:SPFH domain-containing protein [Jatrophihabitans endophyticus]MBE7186682.1 SPFH/Band 7/PHB domain protein [Jatrophihabitans endophyticus]